MTLQGLLICHNTKTAGLTFQNLDCRTDFSEFLPEEMTLQGFLHLPKLNKTIQLTFENIDYGTDFAEFLPEQMTFQGLLICHKKKTVELTFQNLDYRTDFSEFLPEQMTLQDLLIHCAPCGTPQPKHLPQICQKRPVITKRDLYLQKETCIYDKRRLKPERDIYTRQATGKGPFSRETCYKCVKRDL